MPVDLIQIPSPRAASVVWILNNLRHVSHDFNAVRHVFNAHGLWIRMMAGFQRHPSQFEAIPPSNLSDRSARNAASTLVWRCCTSTEHHWEPPISAVCCGEKVIPWCQRWESFSVCTASTPPPPPPTLTQLVGGGPPWSFCLSVQVRRCEGISPVCDLGRQEKRILGVVFR